jgi:GNAT superfamily N-acetyltransferase
MSVSGHTAVDRLGERVTQRWRTIDPLLPAATLPSSDCGAGLMLLGPAGQPVAAGWCQHWLCEPDSLDKTWGAARRFQLTAWIAGPHAGASLDGLLSLWREHLSHLPGSDGDDTAAVVTWPSRDISGVAALHRRGFAPMAVIAARPTGMGANERWHDGMSEHLGKGLRIRRAGPADVEAVVRLGLEVIRFDAQVCSVTERPQTEAALRRECDGMLAIPEPWTWLAERDGAAIGMVTAEPPDQAAWIGPLVGLAPAAYLLLMGVQAGQRGTGVGAALAARLHDDIAAAGVAVTLLHYAQANPLSAPFWSQQGYRPLWTVWESSPASSVR